MSVSSSSFEDVCPCHVPDPCALRALAVRDQPTGHSPHREPAFNVTETSSPLISVFPKLCRHWVFTHTHTHTCHTDIQTHTFKLTHTHTKPITPIHTLRSTHTHTHTYTHTDMHTNTHTHTHTHINMHTHTHPHTHMYTYIHSYTQRYTHVLLMASLTCVFSSGPNIKRHQSLSC